MNAIRFALLAPLALSFTLSATLAHAGDDRYTLSNAYVQECGACHTAYPPGLLPAASWQRLLGDLPHHFGSDASQDAATLKTLGDELRAQAGRSRRVERDPAPPPQDRITRAGWFVREHRELPAQVWQRPAVKSPSNCTACHARADEGDFDERSVRVPR
jgi:hypothetical protein